MFKEYNTFKGGSTTPTGSSGSSKKLNSCIQDKSSSSSRNELSGMLPSAPAPRAGQLVDSIAKTRDAGCRPYMAPERIDPQRARGYDVRSDVWSLGITLIELATGRFPYPKWNSVFEQLTQVVHGDPPQLTAVNSPNGNKFTMDFINFVNLCLMKEGFLPTIFLFLSE